MQDVPKPAEEVKTEETKQPAPETMPEPVPEPKPEEMQKFIKEVLLSEDQKRQLASFEGKMAERAKRFGVQNNSAPNAVLLL